MPRDNGAVGPTVTHSFTAKVPVQFLGHIVEAAVLAGAVEVDLLRREKV